MPEWLAQSLKSGTEVTLGQMALRLGIAFVFGCIIAGLYRLVRRRDATPPSFPPTLVLMAILCAMLPQVIGDHVARAFGLVGALSIVRFRTVVEDTYDIAFVIFAVLVGMAVGANHLLIASLGTVAVGAAALVVQPRRETNRWTSSDSGLVVRLGIGRNPDHVLRDAFEKFFERAEMLAAATGRQGSAVDFTYTVRLRAGATPADIIDCLNRLDGVQSIDLHRE